MSDPQAHSQQAITTKNESESEQQTVMLATCSMAADLELFAMLAASIDRYVDPSIQHVVVVPKAQLPLFTRFANTRREIITQEDVLPFRVWKAPDTLNHLRVLFSGLRRPLYIDSKLRRLRGWMLQQAIKMQLSRITQTAVIVHCDSDMYFVRSVTPKLFFPQGKPFFFSAPLNSSFEGQADWTKRACRLTGAQLNPNSHRTYIENGVVWSTSLVRDLANVMEQRGGRPLHEILLSEPTISEYFLYGVYVEATALEYVSQQSFPICHTLWQGAVDRIHDAEKLAEEFRSSQVSVALQSTSAVTLESRRRLYNKLEYLLS